MSVVVVPAYLLFDRQLPNIGVSWTPILGLTLVTFFSRLMLFLGIKTLGGIQTALLGLSELIVSITVGHIWLHDTLNSSQWIGALFLCSSLILIGFDKIQPEKRRVRGILSWLRPPDVTTDIPLGPHE
jgi:drug/metabolite transporter (DMT)-like permease